MNNFRLVPYLPIDGILPFRDSSIMGVWDVMVGDLTTKRVFFDGTVRDRYQFLEKVKSKDCIFFFCMDDASMSGFFWLDQMVQRRANVHFCVPSEYWGPQAKAMGALTLKTVGNMKDQSGRRVFSMLTGIVESSNKLAVRFAQSIGMSLCGTIPGYLYNSDQDANVEATVLSYVFGD